MKEFINKIVNKNSSLITGAVILGVMCLIFPPEPSTKEIIYAIVTGLFAMTGTGGKQ